MVIDFVRNVVNLILEGTTRSNQILKAADLERKAHIHNFCRMSVAGGEINQAAFCEKVDGATVGQRVADDVFSTIVDSGGHLCELFDVDLYVEVPGVSQECIIFHVLKMRFVNDVLASGGGNEVIAEERGVLHLHNFKAVQIGLNSFDRVDFCDNDAGAHTMSTHGDTAAAPAVTGDDYGFAGDQDIGGVQNGI